MKPGLLTLAAATALCGCSGGGGGSEQFPHLEILASYPVTGAFTNQGTTCAGAESMLVALDVDGDDRFEYRFLFDVSGSVLYGCNGPCEGTIDAEIPTPRRVMIEGVTAPPGEYENVRHDVACRGIADSRNSMGSIVVSPLHFPGLDDTVHAEVPMLRVGAFNGMFSPDNPVAPAMAAALLVPEDAREDVQGHLRIATGGTVVAAGGYDVATPDRAFTDVWEFHPHQIAWTLAATTGTGHMYGNAESFVDANGESAVLFVGGLGTNQLPVLQADVYRHGKATTEPAFTTKPRLFPSTARITDRPDPVIAVLGGCYGTYERDYEYFFPAQPAGCPAPGAAGFCTPAPGALMVEGRCQGALAQLGDGRLWFAAGITDDDELSVLGYVFDGSGPGAYGDPVAAVQTPARLPATIPIVANLAAVFGGLIEDLPITTDATERWLIVDPMTGPVFTGYMREQRGFQTATVLLDGRVLIAGGLNGTGFLASAEILGRGSEEIGGTFDHLPPAGHTTCVPGVDCVQMSEIRYAHQATRIAGSATWLEGSVVITGGSTVAAGGTSELFVPAYHCDGTRPVNPFDEKRVPDVEFCDRLRDPPAITDPRKPRRF